MHGTATSDRFTFTFRNSQYHQVNLNCDIRIMAGNIPLSNVIAKLVSKLSLLSSGGLVTLGNSHSLLHVY